MSTTRTRCRRCTSRAAARLPRGGEVADAKVGLHVTDFRAEEELHTTPRLLVRQALRVCRVVWRARLGRRERFGPFIEVDGRGDVVAGYRQLCRLRPALC